jgi:hypothetical protein
MPLRPATAVFVALAAADTLLAATGHDRRRWLTKPFLMPALMIGRDRPAQRALALGGAGDVALLGRSEIAFTAGLVSFLAGHVAWIMALRQRPGGGLLRARPVLAAPHVAAFGAGMRAWSWRLTPVPRRCSPGSDHVQAPQRSPEPQSPLPMFLQAGYDPGWVRK